MGPNNQKFVRLLSATSLHMVRCYKLKSHDIETPWRLGALKYWADQRRCRRLVRIWPAQIIISGLCGEVSAEAGLMLLVSL
jgi:hypothetical protein